MKHRWTTLLWELWAAQTACAAVVFPPGSRAAQLPAVVLPGLALAVIVPTAWVLWGLWAEPPVPLGPEAPLEPFTPFDWNTVLDLQELTV